MSRAGATQANGPCRNALISVDKDFASDMLMMIQFVDTRDSDWDNPQKKMMFAFPKDKHGRTKYLCKVDPRKREIIELMLGRTKITQNLAEELRTF